MNRRVPHFHSMYSTSLILIFPISGTSPTTVCTTTSETSIQTPSQVISLQRPTTLDLKSKSTPRKCCSGLKKQPHSSSKGQTKKSNIFVRLTSIRRENGKVITSLALKDVEVVKTSSEASKYKTPTPVAENAAAACTAEGHDLFSDPDDTDSLPEGYMSSLKLNALIALIILLVVSAVGTAMLLSIAKIWGNHHDNIWLPEGEGSYPKLTSDLSDHMITYGGHDSNRLLHPKDLSTFLFQYERARRHQKLKKLQESKKVSEGGRSRGTIEIANGQRVKKADIGSMDMTSSSIIVSAFLGHV